MRAIEISGTRAVLLVVGLLLVAFGYAETRESSAVRAAASTQAEQALERQGEVQRAGLAEELKTALGSEFGGVWFDPATGHLHVGVTTPAGRRTAGSVAASAGLADDVIQTSVHSTWQELLVEQERLSHRLADLFSRAEVRTALAPDLNAVEVELGSWVSRSRRVAIENEAAAHGVELAITTASVPRIRILKEGGCKKFATGKAYCDPSLVAGVTIETESKDKLTKYSCTAGPAVIFQDPTHPVRETETFLLTAGHCIEESGGNGTIWYAYHTGASEPEKKSKREPIGAAVEFLNTETDVGVIRIDNRPAGYWSNPGFAPVTPTVAPWVEAEPKPFSVFAETDPIQGSKTCLSGQISGTTCGKIEAVNVQVTKVKELTEVSGVTSAKGDSGGPWFSEASPGLVEGTHVGSNTGNGNRLFQPLDASFFRLKVARKLLTNSNEIRHPEKFHAEQELTTVTSTADGTGKTAHHVIEAAGGTLTCSSVGFEGVQSEKIASALTVSAAYSGCTFIGLPTTVAMGGCNYLLHSSGEFDIASKAGKNCGTEPIKWAVAGCTVEIGSQSPREILTFHNIKPSSTEEVTMEMNVAEIAYKATGASCPKQGEFTDGAYRTGNTILTGAKPGGGAMTNYRWE